jgi:Icc-related predicted phosphoesterase
MKITLISDTHNQHESIPVGSGDCIIHSGDISGRGSECEIQDFLEWYSSLKFKHKIFIAGNHDFGFERSEQYTYEYIFNKYGIHYLNDSGITIEGIKFWGSPVQPEFCDWAFNRSRSIVESMTEKSQEKGHAYIGNHWELIPEDTNVLITHGPPEGIMDVVVHGNESVGCEVLKKTLSRLNKLKLHVFGHIHEARDFKELTIGNRKVIFCNASSLNEYYHLYGADPFIVEVK